MILDLGVARTIHGEMDQFDDRDMFAISVDAGDTLRVDIDARSLGSALDSRVRLQDSNGQELALNDNSVDAISQTPSLDSYLEYTATASATLYLEVTGEVLGEAQQGVPVGAYAVTFSRSPAATEEFFDPSGVAAADKGTTLSDGESFQFTDADGDLVQVDWTGSGSANVVLYGDLTTGADIETTQISDAIIDGDQAVLIEATAGGYSGGQRSITVEDDETPVEPCETTSDPIDNVQGSADDGFSTEGDWGYFPNAGEDGDLHYADPGDGSSTARWTFEDLCAGQYRVTVSWVSHPNRATDAPYTITVDGVDVETVLVDQQSGGKNQPQTGVLSDEIIVAADGSALAVELTNAVNNHVIADKVTIERVN